MYQRSKRRSFKSTSHELRTPAFESLNIEESQKRSRLIEQVGNAFYLSGIALLQLKEERLYRSTHLSFDEFCQDIFGFSSDYAYLKIAAAKVYQNLIDNLPPSLGKPTNGRQTISILPTRQRQLRAIVKAKLDKDAQVEVWLEATSLAVEVWLEATSLADGKVLSSSLVAEAVRAYLAKNNTRPNPFQKGDVCRIVVRGNNQLKR